MGILILPIVTMNLSLFISISFVLNLLLKSLFLHVFACFSSIWTIFLSVLFCMGSALIYLSFSFHPSLLLFPLFLFPWLTLPFFSFTFDSYVFSYLFFFSLQNFLFSIMALPLLMSIWQNLFLYQCESLYLSKKRCNSLAYIMISVMLELIFPLTIPLCNYLLKLYLFCFSLLIVCK